jgi:mRNA (guanine-N7-)-methyltransferase
MKVLFPTKNDNENILTRLRNLLSKTILDSNTELEWRLVIPFGNDDKNLFSNGIPKDVWLKFKDNFEKSNITNTGISESEVSYFRDNIRRITTYPDNYRNDYIEKKIRIGNEDFLMNEIGLRFSISREEEASREIKNNINKLTPEMTRKRKRYYFNFENFTVDFTEIKTVLNNKNSFKYELEIELNNKVQYFDRDGIFKNRNITKGFDGKENIIDLIEPLEQVFSILYPEKDYIIENKTAVYIKTVYDSILKSYNLIKINNSPINLKREHIPKLTNYFVTNKLNGIGKKLFIDVNGIYTIQNNSIDLVYRPSADILSKFKNTILEGEWYENEFYIYDILVLRGTNVTNDILFNRLDIVDKMFKELNPLLVESKVRTRFKLHVKQYFNGSPFKNVVDVLQYMEKKYGEDFIGVNDGIIFTPSGNYKIEHNNSNKIFKWKFPELVTIDFKVTNETSKGKNKEFDLQCLPYYPGKNLKRFESVFDGTSFFPKLVIHSRSEFYDSIKNDMIVECKLSESKLDKYPYFEPYRIRTDKIKPNRLNVVEDNWNDMINPFTKEELIELCKNINYKPIVSNFVDNSLFDINPHTIIKKKNILEPMRSYHNSVKRSMIEKFAKNKSIMDLGFGKGGDIHKYFSSNIKKLYAVEPNEMFINEAKERIRETFTDSKDENKKLFAEKIEIYKEYAQNSIEIKDHFRINKKNPESLVDLVVSFFSMTFFFKTSNDLNKFANTVSGCLKKGGFFVGTFMDGESAFKYIGNKEKIEIPNAIKIKREYDYKETIPKFGMPIEISLESETVNNQIEYLSFFDLLVIEMNKYGLELVETKMFNPGNDMSDEIKKFSRLFRSFVFKRIENKSEKTLNEFNSKIIDNPFEGKTLNNLNANDIELFENTYSKNLVRIGTIGDGSCLFHALFTCNSKQYRISSKLIRKEVVSEFRRLLSESIDINYWRTLGNNSISLFVLTQKLINDFSKVMDKKEYDKYKEEFKRATDKLINTEFENTISLIDEISNVFKNTSIYELIRKNCIKAEIDLFNKFTSDLSDCKEYIGPNTRSKLDLFSFISDTFKLDIYILYDKTRLVYKQGDNCNDRYKKRQSIILLYINDSHYEAIGLKNSEDKVEDLDIENINYILEYDNPTILKLYDSLCEK